MTAQQTEMSHARAKGFDVLEPSAAVSILAEAQVAAAAATQNAVSDIAAAARIAADSLMAGGRLVYAAAGSSGLMAMADAVEMPGTFGISRDQIVILFAGGIDALPAMPGGPEDDGEAARIALAGAKVGPDDCLIAVTASGHTPYPMAAAEAARAAGARVIGIANNADAPLFDRSDIAICLATPPEVIAGSTRMGAGTAQKIALNMLSSMVAVHLGHVHDGYMVNVIADNAKLRGRARRIVMDIAGVSEDRAAQCLELANGAVKLATVLAAGAEDAEHALHLLNAHGQTLRPILAALRQQDSACSS